MRLSIASLIAVAVVPIAVSAAPIRRGIDPGSATVITFAFVLENLETTFYQQALAKFQANDFTTAGFTTTSVPLQEFSTIANDEATHVSTLQSVAESFGIPLPTCRFDFSSVLTSVETMTPVARLVENVGVAAYMGAMTLIGDPLVLEAAASIMTVEARHQTILNVLQGQTAITQAFDIAFTPPEVLAIAGPFISGCELGITSNIPLTVTNTGAVNVGTLLQFSATGVTGVRQGFCQMLTGGLPVAIVLPLSQCIVPQGISGAVAIWITADSQPLIGNPIDRAEQKPLAGPTMAFIDSSSESLGQLVRTSSNSSGTPPSTNVTTTQNPRLPRRPAPPPTAPPPTAPPPTAPAPTQHGLQQHGLQQHCHAAQHGLQRHCHATQHRL
ncbi:ferritin-like domain-containing protein [Lactarius quietus]|nr:ferritin-like domain-containing protein [Lactarius quietus]